MGRTKNLAIAYHELSVMLEAGMPILKSLSTIASSFEGHLGRSFSALVKEVCAGNTLAETMRKDRNVFAPLDVMLVETADTSGNLAQTFKLLSQWYDFSNRLKGIVISGLMLPLALIHIAAVVGPLPFLFMRRMNMAGYIIEVASTLALFYVPAAIILGILHILPGAGSARRFLHSLVLRIPVLGQAVRYLALSRYCRAFNMLYKAGVPITQCAQEAPGVTGNLIIADMLQGGAQSVLAGNPVCEGFSAELPADFLNLWRIGEESGELGNSIKRLADNTTETAEQLFLVFARWLPRLIYFLVCAVIVMQILRGATIIGMR